MLPAGSRLHTSEEFAAVVRLGRRSASPRMVVHLLTGTPARGRPIRHRGWVSSCPERSATPWSGIG